MKRIIEKVLLSRLTKWRAVALLGARQVGKSFLLKEILSDHRGTLISFDDPLERADAARDPVRYLESRYHEGEFLFIDEAARVPEIFSAVKVVVDRMDPKATGICLANSGNYLLLRRIKESLAGRVSLLSLYPLSWQEFAAARSAPGLLKIIEGVTPEGIERPASSVHISRAREERMSWGGFPTPSLSEDSAFRIAWARDYIRTYILPLVVEQFGIRDAQAFERAAHLLLGLSTRFINMSRLAAQIGVSQPTASAFAHQLEAMMVLEFAKVFAKNPVKRLVKQPKLHVIDALLMRRDAGANFSIQSDMDSGMIGPLYESFIRAEVMKTIANYDIMAEPYCWRTQDKAEVDIVLSAGGRILPFEVKWTQRPSRRDASGLRSFLESYRDASAGFIIYPGEDVMRLADDIVALPDWWLLGSA